MQYSIEKVGNGYIARVKYSHKYETWVYSDFESLVNSMGHYFKEIPINQNFSLEKWAGID